MTSSDESSGRGMNVRVAGAAIALGLLTTIVPRGFAAPETVPPPAAAVLDAETMRGVNSRAGETLDLPSFGAITLAAARELGRHDGPIMLDGVHWLLPEQAIALSPHGKLLSLGGIESVDVPLAMALARHRGPLALDGVARLSPAAAAALAELRAPLRLGGLTHLDSRVAAALAVHAGPLFLPGLDTPSAAAAAGLARHAGPLQLDGVTRISYAAAATLARQPFGCRLGRLGGPRPAQAADDPLTGIERPLFAPAILPRASPLRGTSPTNPPDQPSTLP